MRIFSVASIPRFYPSVVIAFWSASRLTASPTGATTTSTTTTTSAKTEAGKTAGDKAVDVKDDTKSFFNKLGESAKVRGLAAPAAREK
jgi:hypothetical protein